MKYETFETKDAMARAATEKAAQILKDAIRSKGHATFIVATGKSQFEFLEKLTKYSYIDWPKTTMFHLDEYVGLPATHPASFRRYLKGRFIDKVPLGKVYLIIGDAKNPEHECERLNRIIENEEIDVAFVGIGENGHLAFNDPPADFDTQEPFVVVELSETCRQQQCNEGWFPKISEVPKKAISITINQLMKSKNVVCVVPGKRKAQAVKHCLEGEVSPAHPASILRTHPHAVVYLDKDSSSLLST